jgi:hypothetical protein
LSPLHPTMKFDDCPRPAPTPTNSGSAIQTAPLVGRSDGADGFRICPLLGSNSCLAVASRAWRELGGWAPRRTWAGLTATSVFGARRVEVLDQVHPPGRRLVESRRDDLTNEAPATTNFPRAGPSFDSVADVNARVLDRPGPPAMPCIHSLPTLIPVSNPATAFRPARTIR